MKKLFLMLAFTGLVASVSATTPGDKDKKATKETKSCCKDKGTEGKACAASGTASSDKKEGKSCCKDKKTVRADVKATK